MTRTTEIQTLEQICRKAATARTIEDVDLKKLDTAFGQRFARAWKIVQERRVKKYVFKPSDRTVWIVVGKGQDYLVMPSADFCTCDDFYFRVMDRQIHLCYHLIAQKLAETLGNYDLYEEDDELRDALMNEWKKAIG